MIKTGQNYCTVYIVRHGQTDWNAKKLIQGHTDIPLNKVGEEQAKVLGEKLKKIKFDAVYSSDLLRTKRTAELITLERKLELATTALLRERRFGKFEGKPWEELEEINKIWEGLNKQQRLVFKPHQEYETDEESVTRFITFLREVASLHLEQTVLIVTHGGLIRVFLNHLTGKTYLRGAVGNSGYIKLKSDGVDFFIEELTDVKEPNE